MEYNIKSLLRGEDGKHRVSIRVKDELLEKLETLAFQADCSRNKIINILLKAAVDNAKIEE